MLLVGIHGGFSLLDNHQQGRNGSVVGFRSVVGEGKRQKQYHVDDVPPAWYEWVYLKHARSGTVIGRRDFVNSYEMTSGTVWLPEQWCGTYGGDDFLLNRATHKETQNSVSNTRVLSLDPTSSTTNKHFRSEMLLAIGSQAAAGAAVPLLKEEMGAK